MSRVKLLAGVAAGIALLAPLVPGSANADEFQATVQVLAVSGTGCPAGSVGLIYPSADSFALLYPEFQVWGGSFKNCQVAARINVPAGWSYTIAQVHSWGWAQLDGQGSATIQTYWYFSDSTGTDRHSMTLPATYNDSWEQVADSVTPQWSTCNKSQTLNINEVISVTGPSNTNSVALFSVDDIASTTVILKYRPC